MRHYVYANSGTCLRPFLLFLRCCFFFIPLFVRFTFRVTTPKLHYKSSGVRQIIIELSQCGLYCVRNEQGNVFFFCYLIHGYRLVSCVEQFFLENLFLQLLSFPIAVDVTRKSRKIHSPNKIMLMTTI